MANKYLEKIASNKFVTQYFAKALAREPAAVQSHLHAVPEAMHLFKTDVNSTGKGILNQFNKSRRPLGADATNGVFSSRYQAAGVRRTVKGLTPASGMPQKGLGEAILGQHVNGPLKKLPG